MSDNPPAVAVKTQIEIDWLEMGRLFAHSDSQEQADFLIGATVGLTGPARDM